MTPADASEATVSTGSTERGAAASRSAGDIGLFALMAVQPLLGALCAADHQWGEGDLWLILPILRGAASVDALIALYLVVTLLTRTGRRRVWAGKSWLTTSTLVLAIVNFVSIVIAFTP